ncbi:MAG TPA: ADOP family duplicated permease [Gemmatimonadaceae bacterium]|nr:ADOP family duplicated permease [Gemmatimonadaceae bacterium]
MLSEFWSDLRYRVRALVRRRDVERELDAELRFHIARETEKYAQRGVSFEHAARHALIAFGGLERTKEEIRDRRGTAFIESLAHDIRYAARGIRAKPAFSAGIVLALALGIGANAAMFAVVDRLLLRPPAYLRDPSRVNRVYLSQTVARQEVTNDYTSIARLVDLTHFTHSFDAVAGFTTFTIAVGDGDDAREIPVSGVSASYFRLFDARPALGRYFRADEDRLPTGAPVAVLGYGYWQSQFGGRSNVLGAKLHVGRTWFTVIGVTPQRFDGFDGGDVTRVPAIWLPLAAFAWNMRPEDHTRDYHWQSFQMAVERAPGVSVAQATADISDALVRSRVSEYPDDPAWATKVRALRPRATLGPVQSDRGPDAGPETKIVLWVSGVALIVLVIACANVANLHLARALARRREIALRLALGVSRARLVRQLLTESLLLAALGGAAGLAVAQWGGRAIRALFIHDGAGTVLFADPRTIAVTIIVTVAAAVGTGLAPAIYALRGDIAQLLGAGAREAGARRSRLRQSLLLVQAMLSVVLLIGAGLFVKSLVNVRHLHLGYDVGPVLVVTENMRGTKMPTPARKALEERLATTAASMPGVVAATPAASVPFWAFEGRSLFVTGIDSVSLLGRFTMQAGDTAYFRTLGTRILNGRGFTAGDGATAPPVTVVSAGMGRVLWPGQNPLGKCIRLDADTAPCITVVGVAEDLHLRSFTSAREFTYYLPIAQDTESTGMLLVRVRGRADASAERVRRGLQALMPGAAYLTATPLGTIIDPAMDSWRLGATMFVAFGALALVLAAVGLYSVIAHGVAQRRQELGVRLALGAPRPRVVAMVVGDGLRTVLAGVVLGSMVGLATGRWSSALLFHESPTDPIVYVAVAAVVVSVALLATAAPAVAAGRVDPTVTLRGD